MRFAAMHSVVAVLAQHFGQRDGMKSMFHAGNRIFSQGAPAEQFWLLTDGRVYLDAEVPGYDNVMVGRSKWPRSEGSRVTALSRNEAR